MDWKYISRLFYTRRVLQNKQIVASERYRKRLLNGEKIYLKNELTYPNKKSKTGSFYVFYKAKKLVLLSLENYVQ